ncbi:MAG: SGNH/GDSL hydrolase family protein, partial [Candidatus Eremiobacteraeota bacterium]|nr:SGNH/GDSL hydrolase family protein [Candidatus Eremiobacteraeota bacterium]
TDAVVFLGTDNLGPLATGQETLNTVEQAYQKILDGLTARKIRIHLITVRNYSLDPKYANPPKDHIAQWQANMQQVSDALDNWILARGYPTLDIRTAADLMSGESYQEAVHFNDAGLTRMAAYISKWFPPAPHATPVLTSSNSRVTRQRRVIAFIGDSATSAVYSPPGFPALIARAVGSPIHNLATVSETRHFASYTIAEALAEQIPHLPSDTTDAVVFLGTDDLSTGYLMSGDHLSAVHQSYLKILDVLKSRHINIHLITVRNFSIDPKYTNPPKTHVAEWQANMQRASDAFDDWILSLGYPTLDIRKDAGLMDTGSYLEAVHFNDLGLQRMAAQIEKWFPPTSSALSGPIPDTLSLQNTTGPPIAPFMEIARLPMAPAHGPRAIVFIGDAGMSGFYSPPGYPVFVAQSLGIPIHNLTALTEGHNPTNYYAVDALKQELPNVPADTTDAVISLGTNDLGPIAVGQTPLRAVEGQVLAVMTALNAAGIRVHVITLRNYASDPRYPNPPAKNRVQWQANMQLAVNKFDDWLLSLGYPTLDVRKYPDLMDNASYNDGIAISEVGQHRIAAHIAKWFQQCDRNNECVTLKTI